MKVNLLYFFKNGILKDINIYNFLNDDVYEKENLVYNIFKYILDKYEEELLKDINIFGKMPNYTTTFVKDAYGDDIIGFNFSTERCFLSLNTEEEELAFIYKREDDSFIYNTYRIADDLFINEREIDKEFLRYNEWQFTTCQELKKKIDALDYNENLIWYDRDDRYRIMSNDSVCILKEDRDGDTMDYSTYYCGDDFCFNELDMRCFLEKAKYKFLENKKNTQKIKKLEIKEGEK